MAEELPWYTPMTLPASLTLRGCSIYEGLKRGVDSDGPVHSYTHRSCCVCAASEAEDSTDATVIAKVWVKEI